ncbi:MAG: hypothetical protein V3U88_07775 [Methylococcales bacterium]
MKKWIRVFWLLAFVGFIDESFVPTSLVGCGEAQTASIDAFGSNIAFGQKRDILSSFRQTLDATQLH